MIKQLYLFFFIIIFSLMYSCSTAVSDEQSVKSTADTENNFDSYEEDFEPLISLDSLLKIEEELNEKLEEFNTREDSKY